MAGAELSGVLKAVEKHYNSARTIQVLFQQSYTPQRGPRRVESGTLFLLKPGRMRWEYQSPAGKLFLADGKNVYLYIPEANRVEKTNLRESEDLRAPLAFLLGKLDFSRDFRQFTLSLQGPDVRVIAEPKSDRFPYTKVEFLVTAGHRIRYLQIVGQDNSLMEFTFEQERVNLPLPASLFQFRMPPGAEVVEASGGDQQGY